MGIFKYILNDPLKVLNMCFSYTCCWYGFVSLYDFFVVWFVCVFLCMFGSISVHFSKPADPQTCFASRLNVKRSVHSITRHR